MHHTETKQHQKEVGWHSLNHKSRRLSLSLSLTLPHRQRTSKTKQNQKGFFISSLEGLPLTRRRTDTWSLSILLSMGQRAPPCISSSHRLPCSGRCGNHPVQVRGQLMPTISPLDIINPAPIVSRKLNCDC